MKIPMVEKGRPIEKRVCSKCTTKIYVGCKPCSIITGSVGAGAFSGGKLPLSLDVGGNLPEILGYDRTIESLKESSNIYLKFGADTNVYGVDERKEMKEIRRKTIGANLKLIECFTRHLGTEERYKIHTRLQEHLLVQDTAVEFNTVVRDVIIEGDIVKGITMDKDETCYASEVVFAIGREGSDRSPRICRNHGIQTQVGIADIDVRVEVQDEVMKLSNKNLHETKLVYYTLIFDDKARTFCINPFGEVATEYYENGPVAANGYAYKSQEYRTNNVNFALLVSKNPTRSFNEPIKYNRHIVQLSNMFYGGRIMVQTFGDFQGGHRITGERLCRNDLIPTLKDTVPGDLSLVLPHRIMTDIKETLSVLDEIAPGIVSDETLLYGVEAKFYFNKVVASADFETSIRGLRTIGGGTSVTRGPQ